MSNASPLPLAHTPPTNTGTSPAIPSAAFANAANVAVQPTIEYTKKARHGHGQDIVDDNNIRQVAGCLPIDPVTKRFLLVSSRKRENAWVIPKGGWESDETQQQAALRETWEEAGVKGDITRFVGVFEERTKRGVKAHHWVYEVKIREVAKKFPEKKKRERRWFTFDEAMIATKSAYLHDAIRASSLNPEHTTSTADASAQNHPTHDQQTITDNPVPKPQVASDLPEKTPETTPPKRTLATQVKSLFQKKHT